ncbi:thiolase domain-containing protein [Microbacterium pseudoresistens]|uniref:Acetyl-CoA C-acetyltransferase n=1 Tax=Microbacterium pseudoresistens TaxID=640634 RepID=A0A7Y9JMK7_9MICO|nr:thiolase domain-containing protein [Microbacterium pseudoresistens]NYD54126.1 acetyl-CoA C-acetyltransferase [Microbacterium pseudoresistens]
MSSKGGAYIVGAYESPDRVIPDRSTAQLTAEVAVAALADAGLTMEDVDGFACTADLDALPLAMSEYLGLRNLRWVDTTMTGGSSPLVQLGHAAAAIVRGQCEVVLITLAQRARSAPGERNRGFNPEGPFEEVYGLNTMGSYALAARRHMYEFGTTSEQLAWVKASASLHAQHNPNAFIQRPITVEEVLDSPMLSDPLHRLDSCVVTDGAGAVVVVSPAVKARLNRVGAKVLGQAETVKGTDLGRVDLTYTGARFTGPRAFEEAGISPSDIDYASIYDSFTITVIETIEDLGFCEKGDGGRFVADGGLLASGRLPVNTDGGGLCNNHPGKGGMMRLIEAVRQVRGETTPAVQVPDCELVLVHGTGGQLGTRMGSSTVILGVEDA